MSAPGGPVSPDGLSMTREEFVAIATRARAVPPGGAPGDEQRIVIPVSARLLSDQLTPVVAYRRLVAPDPRTAPSFLLESVENGDRQGRYSIMGAQPEIQLVARANESKWTRHGQEPGAAPWSTDEGASDDPLEELKARSREVRFVRPPERTGAALPSCALGGWFGFASYDSVRYTEPGKLPFDRAPRDDRLLPDLHFAWHPTVVIFDHAERVMHIVHLAEVRPSMMRIPPAFRDDADFEASAHEAYDRAAEAIDATIHRLQTVDMRQASHFSAGRLPARAPGAGCGAGGGAGGGGGPARVALRSNLTREDHAKMVDRAKEYIASGDVFQVVLGQRFERRSTADPFDVYRALRAVNPSPYMVYMQAEGCILVASSPEILCRVRLDRATGKRIVTNRPLAGTRRRGATPEEDLALERELLADEKERAEHIMLVDLGRNDVGRVCKPATVKLDSLMNIERYSHVMHISSTVTGELRDGLDAWDALRAALPAGTISGAPKVRAMQVIDELEPIRRGPYGGGMGYITPEGEMDIALTLRTMVVPTALRTALKADPTKFEWTYHLQSAGGIVADSLPDPEYDETVNKAAALARAIDLAEEAF